jgi:hypothetical protein
MLKDALPADLPIPEELKTCATSLLHLGVREAAWPRMKALEVVSALKGTAWAILGGVVLVKREGVYTRRYDNWHSDRRPDETSSDFVKRSHHETHSYIERYPEGNAVAFYVLVFKQCA